MRIDGLTWNREAGRWRRMRVAWAATTVLCLLGGAAGCGNLTAGGASDVEVVMASDESEGGEAASPAGVGASPQAALLASPLQGTLRVDVEVRLRDTGGVTLGLTGGVQEVVVPATAGSRTSVTVASVPAGTYAGIEAVFHRVRGEVVGAVAGTTVDFELDLSDGPLELERSEPVVLGTDERVHLVVDLRAGTWVLTPATERLDAFRGAVRLTMRPAP